MNFNTINNFFFYFTMNQSGKWHFMYYVCDHEEPMALIQFGDKSQLHTTLPVVLPTTSRPSAQIKTYKTNIFLTLWNGCDLVVPGILWWTWRREGGSSLNTWGRNQVKRVKRRFLLILDFQSLDDTRITMNDKGQIEV